MRNFRFGYSMKNISLPTQDAYRRKFIEKAENFIRRMRWKAHFFLQGTANNINDKNTFGFKSTATPPQINETKAFEEDLFRLIENIKFKPVNDQFLTTLSNDQKKIDSSPNIFIFADKTRNIYETTPETYNKLLTENITKSYKLGNDETVAEIDNELKSIASKLSISDRVEKMAKREAFVSLKDHKENFQNNPTCRLINPAKSESGKISKVILDRINATLRTKCNVNQWRNTFSVIEWFNNIKDKSKHTFLSFDIVEFYPSISEDLLDKAISWAREVTPISEQEVTIIKHARKSTLFNKEKPWIKKSEHGTFDVTMGSYDGAEVCELIGLLILKELSKRFEKVNVGLYRDDGLVLLKNCTGRLADKARKDLHNIFNQFGLRITAQTNQKTVNFLDATFDLHNGKHQPYRKPNDEPQYISNLSNHPPTILKHLPSAVSKRISLLSSDETSFESAAPLYNDALKRSHFNETVHYTSEESTRSSSSQKRRKRKIIWFNPPFSRNVRTNIGRNFLQLVDKHFPPSNALHKVFNRNTIKISYTCMDNMKSTIMKHNARILSNANRPRETDDKCNCRKKEECPLDGKCLTSSLVYKAIVTSTDNGQSKQYIGMTANTFKERYRNHTKSFQHRKYSNETELSKYIWDLKNKNRNFKINWSVAKHAAAYRNGGKRCNLCLEEKLYIMKANKQSLLNKRTELVSKCRHRNSFNITNSRRAKKKVMTHQASHTP